MSISRRDFVPGQGRKSELSELSEGFLTQSWCKGSSVAALLIFGALLILLCQVIIWGKIGQYLLAFSCVWP